MDPGDFSKCQQICKNLMSEKYKKYNQLFIEPFPLESVPGYLDIVDKKLDIKTLQRNLEAGLYKSRKEFFDDATLIFQNAIKYHCNRETKWISKPAKEMIKVVQKEMKNMDKRPSKLLSKPKAGSLKIKMGKKKDVNASKTAPSAAMSSSSGDAPSPSNMGRDTPTSLGGSDGGGSSKPKVTLKLKSKNKDKDKTAAAKAKPTQPKLKLKLSLGKKSSDTSSARSSPTPPPNDEPLSKPKISLNSGGSNIPKITLNSGGNTTPKHSSGNTTPKISISSGGSSSQGKSAPPKSGAPSSKQGGAPTKPAPAKITLSSKPSKPPKNPLPKTQKPAQQIRLPGGPRGKELPKGVSGSSGPDPKKPVAKPLPKAKKSDSAAAAAKAAAVKPTAVSKASSSSATSSASQGKTAPKTATGKTTKKTGTKKATTKKVKKAAAAAAAALPMSHPSPSGSSAPPPGGAASMMTPIRKIQCSKIISALKRRKQKSIAWFLLPVSDKNIIQDYRSKIKNPMCISAMQSKLDKNDYSTVAQFVLDLRRIFANCLRFNTSIKDRLRPLAVELLGTTEDLMVTFLVRGQKLGTAGSTDLYPPLLYCWSFCIKVLNTLFNVTNPSDGQPTVLYFLHPVTTYCGGVYPPDYLKLVKKPMDFGTITSNLIEGVYKDVDEFTKDCRLVGENCRAYYGGREDGRQFIAQAEQLDKVLNQQIEAIHKYLKSSPGIEMKAKAVARKSPAGPQLFPKPPVSLLMSVLEDVRGCTYTDKMTKITEPAMTPFEKPVSIQDYPDYLQFVQTPMDLTSVEKKTKSGLYQTPEDFEFDMMLVFKNCETYNGHRKGDHLVAMAKYGAKQFRKLFGLRMRTFEDPGSVATKEEQKDSLNPPSKKLKVEQSGGVSKGKAAPKTSAGKTAPKSAPGKSAPSKATPRISITAAQVSSAAAQAAKAKPLPTSASSSNKNQNRAQPVKPNQPVPLHIAIARVKEAYPTRRAHKTLQNWEADCARFFKELMRHPWISAARPKFIFHVPVPVLFPELKDAYMMKVRKPMDLTTVECNLLEGNRYTSADDFVQDVALVFSNAITFNKDGRDVGDPLSCAYYDASVHLLRYSRWLSLELLSKHVADIDAVDEDGEGDDKLPPLSWKLTAGNRKKARAEMEGLVLNEPIEKSVEGDRFTWMEAECEKLLKALRHQSDLRQMTFFITPNYPPDYAAFISKPMDWEKVKRTLFNREYDTCGEIIADLRLIFSNALKYNARLKGTDTVSGRAYEAAKYMSAKLETSINKVMLSVSDRLERERIDHANAEREIEAAERAEEARIRATWKKEASTDGAAASTSSTNPSLKIRPVRKQMKRRESTDFEIPFFDDEDDGQHERSYFDAVKQQKALFEKQRQDLAKMRQLSMTVGAGLFARMAQREKAKKWVQAMEMMNNKKSSPKTKQTESKADTGSASTTTGSSVLTELEKEGRKPVELKLASFGKKKKKRKRPAITFEVDGDD